jgi:hypothetical protein
MCSPWAWVKPLSLLPSFAIFYTKVRDRVLRPLFAVGQPRPRPAHHRKPHRPAPRRRQAARSSLKLSSTVKVAAPRVP